MQKNIYFGITELEGDLFLLFSLDNETDNHDFDKEDLNRLFELEEKEIYLAIDNIFQAPEECTYEYLLDLLNNDFTHSKELDNLLLKELI